MQAWLVPGSSAIASSARLFSAAAATAAAQPDSADAFAKLAGPGPAGNRPVVTGSVLKRHGRDLTREAADGRLDPLIGRHDVLERALQVAILSSPAIMPRALSMVLHAVTALLVSAVILDMLTPHLPATLFP
jgi:hypothetical protein